MGLLSPVLTHGLTPLAFLQSGTVDAGSCESLEVYLLASPYASVLSQAR